MVVRVGIGVIVQDPMQPHKIYAGIRADSSTHGNGTLALPGGHLEMYETWIDCAIREVYEEMDLNLDPSTLQMVHVTNDIFEQDNKHYITIFMMGKCSQSDVSSSKRPINKEPHKCFGWNSYSWKELQEICSNSQNHGNLKIFGPLQKLLQDEPESVIHFLNH